MNYFLDIQLNIFMVLLLGIILIHAVYKLNIKHFIDKVFIIVNALTIIMLLLEGASVLLNNFSDIRLVPIHKIVNIIGFIITPMMSAILLYTTIILINKKKLCSNKERVVFLIPIVFNMIISILSYKFDLIFNITNTNIYQRGPLFFLSPLISYSYTVINIIIFLKNKNKFYRDEIYFSLLVILAPLIMGIIQIKYFVYLTIWNTTAIVVCISYICILNTKMKTDPLTGIENRLAYDEYIKRFNKKKKEHLYILYIDINNFKEINDNYGHTEGDKVLTYFASILKKVFYGVGRVMRIGGDEFIVLIDDNIRIDIQPYIRRLNNMIECEENTLQYDFTFSYGFAKKDFNDKNVDSVIKKSDELMYKNKSMGKK